MKKSTLFFVFLVIGLLVVSTSPAKFVSAQSILNAFNGKTIPDSQIDGKIGPEWDDAGSFTNTNISPDEIAHVCTKQDGTYLYIAITFLADSTNPWVAIQFGTSLCMSTTADGALFGDDNYAANGYTDIHFTQGIGIAPDAIQDGIGAISVNASNYATIELKKPLNSLDTSGKDINWTPGKTYTIVIMWSSQGNGSSGGTTTHSSKTPIGHTLLIDEDPKTTSSPATTNPSLTPSTQTPSVSVPELQSWILVPLIAGALFFLILTARKKR